MYDFDTLSDHSPLQTPHKKGQSESSGPHMPVFLKTMNKMQTYN